MLEKRKSLQELIDEYSSQLMMFGGDAEAQAQDEKNAPAAPVRGEVCEHSDEAVPAVSKSDEEPVAPIVPDCAAEGFSLPIADEKPENLLDPAPEPAAESVPAEEAPPPADPPEPAGYPYGGLLRVFVGDKYGRAIAGARVQICMFAGDEQYQSAVEFTETNGMTRRFDLPGELFGQTPPRYNQPEDECRYDVFCVASGFHPVRIPVKITPGQESEKTVLMRNLT
ncbi:MAG: hypothetical protein FWE86_05185 [Oscillospiraceae bacterium]|nr:hypothetical protein [Oscillospiraceae bacterium]